jgi:hypothetical protein
VKAKLAEMDSYKAFAEHMVSEFPSKVVLDGDLHHPFQFNLYPEFAT